MALWSSATLANCRVKEVRLDEPEYKVFRRADVSGSHPPQFLGITVLRRGHWMNYLYRQGGARDDEVFRPGDLL